MTKNIQSIFLSPAETQNPLILEPQEDTVYFLPSAVETTIITLNLTTPGVRAFLVGLFHTNKKADLTLNQNHLAPNTESHILLKTLVAPEGNFSYQGNIRIERKADNSIASQEARGLLQGAGARFKAVPGLEILPKNVVCTHKASSSPVNKDSLFTLQTKGLSASDAKVLLETAFLRTAFDTLENWNIPEKSALQYEEQIFGN